MSVQTDKGSKVALACLCGGVVLSLADDPSLAEYMDADGLYCVEDDEVLTELDVWMVLGLYVPIHDMPEGMDEFDSLEALIADLEALRL